MRLTSNTSIVEVLFWTLKAFTMCTELNHETSVYTQPPSPSLFHPPWCFSHVPAGARCPTSSDLRSTLSFRLAQGEGAGGWARVPMMGVPQMDPRSAPDMMGAPEGEETRMGMRTEPRGRPSRRCCLGTRSIYIHTSHGEPWSMCGWMASR